MSVLPKPQAIFCDRDGTLIEDEHFLDDPRKIRWIPGVKSTLKQFKQWGTKVLVVTNQSGIARGYFDPIRVEKIHWQLQMDLQSNGAEITSFYYCPHHPEGTIPQYSYSCQCRKPFPGMFLQGIQEHSLDPRYCWAIGDRLRDLEPALQLGMKVFLVQTGYGQKAEKDLVNQVYGEKVTVLSSLADLLTL